MENQRRMRLEKLVHVEVVVAEREARRRCSVKHELAGRWEKWVFGCVEELGVE